MVEIFYFKKNSLIIFFILIILFFSLGVIHASEISSNDFILSDSVIEQDDSVMDVTDDFSHDDSSLVDGDVSGVDDSSLVDGDVSGVDDSSLYMNLYKKSYYYVLEGNSFESIQYAIDSVEENSIVVLNGMNGDGSPSNFYGNGSQIVINKSITLDGQGVTLDAQYLSRIFYITANDVTLTNLNLINANHRDWDIGLKADTTNYPYGYYGLGTTGGNGGVIKWLGDNGCLQNTVFSHNIFAGYSKMNGRIISWEGKNGTVINSYFGRNFMIFHGGLIGFHYETRIIDAPVYGDYDGELGNDNIFIRDVVVNIDPEIAIGNVSRYFGSYEKVFVNLTTVDGFVFSNVNVSVNISNDKISKIVNCSSDSKGLVKFNVNDLPVGTYVLSVKFDDFCFNSTLAIVKAPVKFVYSAYKTYYGSGSKFNVKLVNSKDNSLVAGVKVSLKVYTGNYYKTLTATTNSKGVASFSLSKYGVGSHKIIISANGNVVSAQKSSSITITKASTNIKLSKTSFKYKKSDYLKMTLTNKNTKKPVSNIIVKVKVYTGKSYKTYSLKTDQNGIIKINTKGLKKGSHKIVISSSSKCYAISKTATIKVK